MINAWRAIFEDARLALLCGFAMLAIGTPASAQETFRFRSVASDPSGTVQIIELEEIAGADGHQRFTGHTLSVTNRAGVTKTLTFTSDLPTSATGRRRVAIVTPALVYTVGGISSPYDYVMPDRFLPTEGGVLELDTGDAWQFPPIVPGPHGMIRSGFADAEVPHAFSGKEVWCACLSAPLVEYYNPQTDHYFITDAQPDIDALDSGRIPGWVRTGEPAASYVWANATDLYFLIHVVPPLPVCRFFIPPASHFISASASECEDIAVRHPEFVLESWAAFYAWLPNQAGECPVDTYNFPTDNYSFKLVYRLWNGRPDTNHRFTTSPAIRDQMIARGWILEGYGSVPAVMCVVG
jgi:hypothetical protein